MISERTLKQWRRDSLVPPLFDANEVKQDLYHQMLGTINILNQRILRLTQVLLDEHLKTKGK